MGVNSRSALVGRPAHPGVHVTADVTELSKRVGGRPRVPVGCLVGLVFLLALANRLVPVLRGGGLSGVISYDDGVYYAGAVGLVHGQLPYRDFLFLHPPGVLVALAPVAAVGRWIGETSGWEVSRLVWMVMGSLTSAVVLGILLPLGKLPAALAGCAYAVFPGAVLVERTTFCEGLANLCLAVALLLLIRDVAATSGDSGRRPPTATVPLLVGAILGFATTVKIWGLVPLAVVCVYALIVLGVRRGLAVAVGGGLTITAICLPFFVAAPAEMWRMVVLDQVGRDQGTVFLLRAAQIATMGRLTEGGVAAVVVIVTLIGVIAGSVVAWRVKPYRVVVPLLATTVGLLLVSPIFFPHYLGNLAVPLALLAGVVAGGITAQPGRHRWRAAATIVLGVVVIIDVLALSRIRSGDSVPAELAAAVRPAPGCLTSDDPNNLLALAVVGRNIGRGCRLVVDLGGYSHDLSRGATVRRGRNAAWQQVVVEYLGSGEYALATRFGTGRGLTKVTATEIESWPVRLEVDSFALRQPPN